MDIYQHFRKEEQPFIDKVLSWKELAEKTYQPKLTDFLDPRQQQILEMLIGTTNDDLKLHFHGGGSDSERKRAIISYYYEEVGLDDFQLVLAQAAYNNKFIVLEHRDVMGAFLSLGIKREKLGDISVSDGVLQIVLAEEISSYVFANLTSIKNAAIQLEEKPLSEILNTDKKWLETEKTVSSLRLDVILKEMYSISRKDAALAVSKKYAKVNFKVIEDPSYMLQAGDLLSLRGKGRGKLVSINGQTKKEKWRIIVAILK